MIVREFISKWTFSTLKERSGSEEHFFDLCRLLLNSQAPALLTRRSRSERRGSHAKCSFQSLGVSRSTWEAGWVSTRWSTSTR
jgi:hypothetical protein